MINTFLIVLKLWRLVHMIYFKKTSVFNSGCEAIVNTINCDGVMGKGLALEFSLRFPNMFEEYKKQCESNLINVGKIYKYYENNQVIINFPTKKHWKYPSKLEWIEEGLKYFSTYYKELKIASIAFPPLGTNNGGLVFENGVKQLMEKYLSNLDIDVIICFDPDYPEGKEKEMVESIRNDNIESLCMKLNIKTKQALLLKQNINKINRFFNIMQIEGVGSTTYKKLFNYYYNIERKNEQLTLF